MAEGLNPGVWRVPALAWYVYGMHSVPRVVFSFPSLGMFLEALSKVEVALMPLQQYVDLSEGAT